MALNTKHALYYVGTFVHTRQNSSSKNAHRSGTIIKEGENHFQVHICQLFLPRYASEFTLF